MGEPTSDVFSGDPSPDSRRKRRRRLDDSLAAATSTTQRRACSACRLWKVRCDGERPFCSSCANRQVTCTYPSEERKHRCTQAQVNALEAHIRSLERQLGSNAVAQVTGSPATTTNNSEATGVNSKLEGLIDLSVATITSVDHDDIPRSVDRPLDDDTHNTLLQPSPNDATDSRNLLVGDGMMITCASTSPGDNVGSENFHESSSLTFARSLDAFEPGWGGSRNGPEPPRHGSSGHRGADGLEGDEEFTVKAYLMSSSLSLLPTQGVARILFEQYMKSAHPITPYLLEQDVRRDFEKLWTLRNPPPGALIAQFNLIFAMGCLFHDDDIEGKLPLDNVATAGEQFFQRAWGYIVANAFGVCTVEFLQLLLLAIQYQQGTNRANQCWLSVGHAIRIAQCLGLYVDLSLKPGKSPLKVELYRRLWWGCYNLDRVSSMIYGRPMGITLVPAPEPMCSLPLAVDDVYCAKGQDQPADIPSIYAFFTCSVRLYLLMDQVFQSLRTPLAPKHDHTKSTTSVDERSLLSRIVDLDARLLDWHDALPEFLKFNLDEADDTQSCFPNCAWLPRQRCILKLRFLGMRILLHRQSILFLLRPWTKSKSLQQSPAQWLPVYSDFSAPPQQRLASVSSGLLDHSGKRALDRALAQASARICVSAVQTQIDCIISARPLALTGAWWWDFHYLFNDLCILLAAMKLPPNERQSLLKDDPRTKSCIASGCKAIHQLAERGGSGLVHGERFLYRLRSTILDLDAESTRQSGRLVVNGENDETSSTPDKARMMADDEFTVPLVSFPETEDISGLLNPGGADGSTFGLLFDGMGFDNLDSSSQLQQEWWSMLLETSKPN